MTKIQSGSGLYKEAGVDTSKGDALVDWLHADRQETVNPTGSLVSGIGGFASLFRPNLKSLKDPLIVASTDGVGTKVLLGLEIDMLAGLGEDLVAMCVNDLYTLGARPMFFLDYYATGKLQEADFRQVLTGIKLGCRQAKMSLIGGETAELPGLYAGRHFDLAGFVVGIVDGESNLGPDRVKAGDLLYGMQATGFHSNGYSLLRKWLSEMPPSPTKTDLQRQLMIPTKIYHEIPELLERVGLTCMHSLAHITGGGISGNLPRVIPENLCGHISINALPTPTWMRDLIIDQAGSLQSVEEVFNLGVGMVATVARDQQGTFEKECLGANLPSVLIGEVKSRGPGDAEVCFH